MTDNVNTYISSLTSLYWLESCSRETLSKPSHFQADHVPHMLIITCVFVILLQSLPYLSVILMAKMDGLLSGLGVLFVMKRWQEAPTFFMTAQCEAKLYRTTVTMILELHSLSSSLSNHRAVNAVLFSWACN